MLAILLAFLIVVLGVTRTASEPPVPLPSRALNVTTLWMPHDDYAHDLIWLNEKQYLSRAFTPEIQRRYWIEDFNDLASKDLVKIPDSPSATGFRLRTTGAGRIGQMETKLGRLDKYYELAPAAAGVLYKIRDHLQALEGKRYQPFEITSLVRSWEYQQMLLKENGNADVIRQGVPATHVLGLAFDITRVGMNKRQEHDLETFLGELYLKGEIVYFREDKLQSTFHIAALPRAERQLSAYYTEHNSR